MTLNEYEKRLKAANPRLHIKRYGTSMAGIHNGNKFVCRIPQGEILEHNVFEVREGQSDQYKTQFNPLGWYKYKYMTRRGRSETARILYTQGLISYPYLPTLS